MTGLNITKLQNLEVMINHLRGDNYTLLIWWLFTWWFFRMCSYLSSFGRWPCGIWSKALKTSASTSFGMEPELRQLRKKNLWLVVFWTCSLFASARRNVSYGKLLSLWILCMFYMTVIHIGYMWQIQPRDQEGFSYDWNVQVHVCETIHPRIIEGQYPCSWLSVCTLMLLFFTNTMEALRTQAL